MKINLPTKITLSRIIASFLLILAIIVIYIVDQYIPFVSNANFKIGENVTMNWIMLILFFVFLVASLTDFLDGYLARKNNEVTDLGKFLDPIADKMLVNSMLIFLSLNFVSLNNSLNEQLVKFPFFLVILMIIRDLVVDGLRLMAAKKNVVISANIFGKLKTVLQMVSISLVFLNGFPFSFFDYGFNPYLKITTIFCYLTTLASLISGIIYVIQNRFVFIGGKNNE